MATGMRRVLLPIFPAVLFPVVLAGPANSQVATALLTENQQLPGAAAGQIVTSLNNSAVNHVGGYAAQVGTLGPAGTLSHIWGNPTGGAGTVIRTEGTYGSLVQGAYESFYGMSNTGQVCYSATGTGGPVGGFDSVWLDDTPIAVEGDPVPSLPGQYWVFASRPGVTATGDPYWVSGFTNTIGGSTQNRGLFRGAGASVVLQGGQAVAGLPFPLNTGTAVDFDYRFSALGTRYIAPVVMVSGSTTHDDAFVLSGSGLMLGGSLVRELTPIPASVGGLGGENWDNFDFCGVTESGQWFFTGDTDGATTTDEIVVNNSGILYREGMSLDGETLSGDIEAGYINENGDLALIWDVVANTIEALIVNKDVVLREGDQVDLSGDGIAEANTKLVNFTGISALTMSDRDVFGNVNVYFTADIDTLNTSSTLDDVEGFFCLKVSVDTPIAVRLTSFEVLADPVEPVVNLRWSTTAEVDHMGFHVYRALQGGNWERLTTSLLTGEDGTYSYRDLSTLPSRSYSYKLGAIDRSGREDAFGPISLTTPAWLLDSALRPNTPNPFRSSTELSFRLSESGPVVLDVFDAGGRLVRQLVDQSLEAGEHQIVWDGRSDEGDRVSGGVYFYRLTSAGQSLTRKMILVRGE
jgi:hypothetical protein